MVREDAETLRSIGFSPEELAELDLIRPASGAPEDVADVYLRRSKKREDLATLRGHLREVERWARAHGVGIRHVWVEQRSASKAHVRRDVFEAAKAAVLAGRSKTLVVWKTDRLDRRGMAVVGSLLDELDKRRSRLVSVSEGLDSSKGGRLVFAILSERARDEAHDIALRVQVGLDAHRILGRHPGGRTPFGVKSLGDGQVGPDPAEYPVARAIAEALLDGNPGTKVAHRMNAEGHLTRSGRHWSPNGIARMVHSPLWAGLVPNREREKDEFGNPIDKWAWKSDPLTDGSGRLVSCGTGVVSVSEWFLIKSLMSTRTARGIGGWHGVRQASKLLTGIMRCAACGVGVVSGGGDAYRCRTRLEGGAAACQGGRTRAARANFFVSEMWVTHVSALSPEDPVLHVIANRWFAYQDPERDHRRKHLLASVDDAKRRSDELDDAYYVYGRIPADRYTKLSAALASQIDAQQEELESLLQQSDLTPLLEVSMLAEAWEAASLTDQRMLLKSAVERLELAPARKQGDRAPLTDRITVKWVSGEAGMESESTP